MDIGFRGEKDGRDAAQTHSLSITKKLPLQKPQTVTYEGRASLYKQPIIKCVPQAFDHVCHLNICTWIGLLFSHVLSGGQCLVALGGARCLRHGRPPRWKSMSPPTPLPLLAGLGRASQRVGRGRLNDHCSVSLSSRRESALSALALAPACSRSASAG